MPQPQFRGTDPRPPLPGTVYLANQTPPPAYAPQSVPTPPTVPRPPQYQSPIDGTPLPSFADPKDYSRYIVNLGLAALNAKRQDEGQVLRGVINILEGQGLGYSEKLNNISGHLSHRANQLPAPRMYFDAAWIATQKAMHDVSIAAAPRAPQRMAPTALSPVATHQQVARQLQFGGQDVMTDDQGNQYMQRKMEELYPAIVEVFRALEKKTQDENQYAAFLADKKLLRDLESLSDMCNKEIPRASDREARVYLRKYKAWANWRHGVFYSLAGGANKNTNNVNLGKSERERGQALIDAGLTELFYADKEIYHLNSGPVRSYLSHQINLLIGFSYKYSDFISYKHLAVYFMEKAFDQHGSQGQKKWAKSIKDGFDKSGLQKVSGESLRTALSRYFDALDKAVRANVSSKEYKAALRKLKAYQAYADACDRLIANEFSQQPGQVAKCRELKALILENRGGRYLDLLDKMPGLDYLKGITGGPSGVKWGCMTCGIGLPIYAVLLYRFKQKVKPYWDVIHEASRKYEPDAKAALEEYKHVNAYYEKSSGYEEKFISVCLDIARISRNLKNREWDQTSKQVLRKQEVDFSIKAINALGRLESRAAAGSEKAGYLSRIANIYDTISVNGNYEAEAKAYASQAAQADPTNVHNKVLQNKMEKRITDRLEEERERKERQRQDEIDRAIRQAKDEADRKMSAARQREIDMKRDLEHIQSCYRQGIPVYGVSSW